LLLLLAGDDDDDDDGDGDKAATTVSTKEKDDGDPCDGDEVDGVDEEMPKIAPSTLDRDDRDDVVHVISAIESTARKEDSEPLMLVSLLVVMVFVYCCLLWQKSSGE
jgi:hypothetical protein